MPVWVKIEKLDGFKEVKYNGDGVSSQDKLQQQDLDALEGYSPAIRHLTTKSCAKQQNFDAGFGYVGHIQKNCSTVPHLSVIFSFFTLF